MSEQVNHSDYPAAVTVFDGTYREVMDLLKEAKTYAETPSKGSVPGTSVAGAAFDRSLLVRMELSCESFRITARLAHCMAWVLIHKAISAGELPPDAAYEPQHRLDGGAVCLAQGGETNPELPRRLRALLASSRRLYARLARLDARVSANAVLTPGE